MSDPEVIGDRERYAEVGREYRQLEPAREAGRGVAPRAPTTPPGARELLAEDGDDPELREMLRDLARRASSELEEEIRLAMVERDPNDDKNVIVEIQGGAGGDEAGLWAGDLYRMLTPLRRAPRLQGRAARRRRRQVHVRGQGRRRLLACSSSRAARTASSACPRPSRRAASTPRRRPSRCCPRPRTSTSQVDPNDLADRRLPLVRARAASR